MAATDPKKTLQDLEFKPPGTTSAYLLWQQGNVAAYTSLRDDGQVVHAYTYCKEDASWKHCPLDWGKIRTDLLEFQTGTAEFLGRLSVQDLMDVQWAMKMDRAIELFHSFRGGLKCACDEDELFLHVP